VQPEGEHLAIVVLGLVVIVALGAMVVLGIYKVPVDPVSNICSAAIGAIAGVTGMNVKNKLNGGP
jgi:hypothetical protein